MNYKNTAIAIGLFVAILGLVLSDPISAYKSDPLQFIIILVATILALVIGYSIAFFLGRKAK